MNARFKRGFTVPYAVFTSARHTVIAQILILLLFGALTIVGMNDVAKYENEKAIVVGMP